MIWFSFINLKEMKSTEELTKIVEDYFNNTSIEDFKKDWDSLTDSDPVESPLAIEYIANLNSFSQNETGK